jgi:DUF971 family protein
VADSTLHFKKAALNREEKTLDVLWSDDHVSVYPLKLLRVECPCATCRHARDDAKRNPNPFRIIDKPVSAELANLEAVGRYAIQLNWKDGHNTGIYAFDYLREICPCEACVAARKPDDAPYVHGIYIPK